MGWGGVVASSDVVVREAALTGVVVSAGAEAAALWRWESFERRRQRALVRAA